MRHGRTSLTPAPVVLSVRTTGDGTLTELCLDVCLCLRAIAATAPGAAELVGSGSLRFTAQALAATLARTPGPRRVVRSHAPRGRA